MNKLYNFIDIFFPKIPKTLIWDKVGAYNTNLISPILVSTKNSVLLLKDSEIFQILVGEYYGITRYKNKIFILKELGDYCIVVVFSNLCKGSKVDIFIDQLPTGCHQIDLYQDKIWITDTYNNRVIIFTLSGEKYSEFYPIGKLLNGRDSDNYGHINSIFIDGNSIIKLLCHNETSKTGKNSEILNIDMDFRLVEKKKIDAHSAHNIAIVDEKEFVCDSLRNRLVVDSKEVFSCSKFTRGLAINREFILIGGSQYAKREHRKTANGMIYILARDDYKLLEKIDLPSMVQEIRYINGDNAFSSNSNKGE